MKAKTPKDIISEINLGRKLSQKALTFDCLTIKASKL